MDEETDDTSSLMRLGYVAGVLGSVESIKETAASCQTNKDGTPCETCVSALAVAGWLTARLEARLEEWQWPPIGSLIEAVAGSSTTLQ